MKKVLLSGAAIATITMMSIAPAFAATTDITTQGATDVPITAIIESQFTVTVPKNLDLTSGTANYNITVSGDIASNEKLKVTPSATVEMTEANTIKTAINATVTQSKKEWTYTDVSSSMATSGTITADLTAGNWSGVLAFNITLE